MGFDVGAHLVRVGIVLSTSDHASVVSINIFVALLCSCIVIGHLLEENRWMNESITALIIMRVVHWGGDFAHNQGEELAFSRIQQGSLLYLPSPADHIQCGLSSAQDNSKLKRLKRSKKVVQHLNFGANQD